MFEYPLDFAQFKAELIDATRKSYKEIRANLPKDDLYLFGLYTSGERNYVLPTASSEQGLIKAVADYKEEFDLDTVPDEILAAELRLSPCDSPFHEQYADSFEDVSNQLSEAFDEFNEQLDDMDDDESREVYDRWCSEIDNVFVETLQQLDKEGLFGKGKDREKLFLAVLEGDQSDENRIDFVRKLNPPAVAARYEVDTARSYHAMSVNHDRTETKEYYADSNDTRRRQLDEYRSEHRNFCKQSVRELGNTRTTDPIYDRLGEPQIQTRLGDDVQDHWEFELDGVTCLVWLRWRQSTGPIQFTFKPRDDIDSYDVRWFHDN